MSNLYLTNHFIIRANERKSDIYPDANGIIEIVLNEIPLGILKQSEEKFKLIYPFNDDNDYVIIMSIKETNPLRINLISCFPEESKKRRRDDASTFGPQ